MKYDPVVILTNGDMSQSTVNSIGIDLQQLVSFSIQAVFTGSPVGTFVIQTSNDKVPMSQGADPAANVTNWSTYTNSSQAISAAGNFMWNAYPAGYRWVRLLYTKTSGTGSVSASFVGKG